MTLRETLKGQPKSSEQRLADMEARLTKIEEYMRPPPASDGPSKPDQILELVTLLAEGMDRGLKELATIKANLPPKPPAGPSGRQ